MKDRKGYYEKNKERELELHKIYRKNNLEKVLKKERECRKNNPTLYGEYQKKWAKTERGKAVNQRRNITRRTKERNSINTLTSQEWLDTLEAYNYRCAYCGVEFNCELLPERDHIIPISKDGHNTKENVVPTCRSCNVKKSDKLIKPSPTFN